MGNSTFSQRLRSSGIWAAFGRILSGVLLLGLHALLARSFTTVEYGQYVFGEALALIVTLVCMAGVPSVMLRMMKSSLAAGDETQANRVAGSAIKLFLVYSLATSFLAAGITFLFADQLSDRIESGYFWLLAWGVLAAGLRVTSEIYRAHDSFSWSYAIGGQNGGLLVNMGLVSVAWFVISLNRMSLMAMFLTQAVLQATVLAMFVAPLRRRWAHRDSQTVWILALAAFPLLLQQLISIGLPEAGKLFLSFYASDTDAAFYNAATRLVILAHVPLMVINNAITPFVSELYSTDKKAELTALLRGTATLSAIPCLAVFGVFLFAPGFVLNLAFGPEFVVAIPTLQFLTVGSLAWVLSGSCGLVLTMTGHERSAMLGTLIPGVVYLVCCPWLAARYGHTGAAAASMILQLVSNTLCMAFVYFHCGIITGITTSYSTIGSCLRLIRSHE